MYVNKVQDRMIRLEGGCDGDRSLTVAALFDGFPECPSFAARSCSEHSILYRPLDVIDYQRLYCRVR
jgi:hypothetical protein